MANPINPIIKDLHRNRIATVLHCTWSFHNELPMTIPISRGNSKNLCNRPRKKKKHFFASRVWIWSPPRMMIPTGNLTPEKNQVVPATEAFTSLASKQYVHACMHDHHCCHHPSPFHPQHHTQYFGANLSLLLIYIYVNHFLSPAKHSHENRKLRAICTVQLTINKNKKPMAHGGGKKTNILYIYKEGQDRKE
jgi:hypothetical protein